MSKFLTDAELIEYTGRSQPAAQVRVLRKWKIAHIVNGANRVRVTWDAVNASISPKTDIRQQTKVDLSLFEHS